MYRLDILPDRQGGDGRPCDDLLAWLNGGALKKFEALVQEARLEKSSSDEVVLRDGVFGIRQTQLRYGYFYVVAWQLKENKQCSTT